MDFGRELSLESPPPSSSFAQHQAPAVQDGESHFSKLLDPCWSELAISHLRDTGRHGRRDRSSAKTQAKSQAKEQGSGSEQLWALSGQADGMVDSDDDGRIVKVLVPAPPPSNSASLFEFVAEVVAQNSLQPPRFLA